jgi:Predicted Zn-dependent protease (DUF2268)
MCRFLGLCAGIIARRTLQPMLQAGATCAPESQLRAEVKGRERDTGSSLSSLALRRSPTSCSRHSSNCESDHRHLAVSCDRLDAVIHCLFESAPHDPQISAEVRNTIISIATAAERDIRQLLPRLPAELELVTRTGARVIPETGELGSATSPRRVTWTVDPSGAGGIETIARTQLRATLFHELHHVARGWTKVGGAPTARFIDGVIAEGLATAFERDYGGRAPLWGQYPDDVMHWVQELLPLPRSAPYASWMYRHPDGRRWIGYRAGTFIADQAIRASHRSAAALVNASSDEVLRLAGISQ